MQTELGIRPTRTLVVAVLPTPIGPEIIKTQGCV